MTFLDLSSNSDTCTKVGQRGMARPHGGSDPGDEGFLSSNDKRNTRKANMLNVRCKNLRRNRFSTGDLKRAGTVQPLGPGIPFNFLGYVRPAYFLVWRPVIELQGFLHFSGEAHLLSSAGHCNQTGRIRVWRRITVVQN